ncbi:MAG: bifunctional response regulator/alkaline phosphatase family protein [Bacteroidales bacterium]|nr:bifunctional response regulator/alkaline phosphatase family protein [Bacteroidales bacterium]
MRKIKILWTDDEMDLLRPYIMFLEEKGYEVMTASNGEDAIHLVQKNHFDLIFLDENMPGLSGLETLNKIKADLSAVPVIMITKSEEENIMDAAIGSKIADYLIKPVNPNQILLAIKKNIDTKKLVTKETTSAYQTEFRNIGLLINSARTYADWEEIYRKIVYWELELEKLNETGMSDILMMQKAEADQGFAKFIKSSYLSWFDTNSGNRPLISPNIFKEKVFPLVDNKKKVFVILVDNLRYDQWKTIHPIMSDYFIIEEDEMFCSILPTATQYARNAMFAGLMPEEIQKLNPSLWLNDDEEGAKNMNEEELLVKQMTRLGKKFRFHYEKVLNSRAGKKLVENFSDLIQYDLVVIVYNFIDLLSHTNTEMEMIRELAGSDSAYRSLTHSWFQHSHIHDLIKLLSEKDIKIIFTTDHGSLRVNNPVKVIGDKKTSVNLRYKMGKNLNYNRKDVFEITDPYKAHLPKSNVTSKFIFASQNDFFVYPNNYNYYVNYYKNTFQHGGISMEEMLVPLITMSSKG